MEFKLFATLFEWIMFKMTIIELKLLNWKGKTQADGTINLLQMVQGHTHGHQILDMWQERTFAFES